MLELFVYNKPFVYFTLYKIVYEEDKLPGDRTFIYIIGFGDKL